MKWYQIVSPKFFADLVLLRVAGEINDYGFKKALDYKVEEIIEIFLNANQPIKGGEHTGF